MEIATFKSGSKEDCLGRFNVICTAWTVIFLYFPRDSVPETVSLQGYHGRQVQIWNHQKSSKITAVNREQNQGKNVNNQRERLQSKCHT